MKKLTFLVAALCATMAVSAVDQTSTFVDKDWSVGDGELTWTKTGAAANAFEADRGVQTTLANIKTSGLTLSCTGVTEKVKAVAIVLSANGADGSIESVKVGETVFMCGEDASYSIASGTKNQSVKFEGSASGTIVIKFASTATAKSLYVKSITVTTAVAGAPEDPTFSVAEGLYTSAQSVELTCATEGASIYYTLDGSTPDKSATLYEAAIPVSKTTTIKAVAIKDDIASSIVSATYTLPEEVADLAAFIAKADKENYVRILSECVVTFQLDEKNVYVQDASAGMLIYLKTGGLATYKAGDRLTGIIGKFTTYSGQNQLAPALEAMPTPVAGDALTPAAVTIPEVVADIQNQYIKLSSVSFKADATFKKGTIGSGVNVTDGTNELVLYNKFTIMDGTYAASKKYDIVGIAVWYSTSSKEYMEIFPISLTEQSTTAIESVEMSNIYAHSGRIYGAEQGRIYTINGMDVTEQNGQLSNGIYIVKVGAKATKIAVK